MNQNLYDLFDIDPRGAVFADLASIRNMFDEKNREAGQFALQVPTDDQIRMIEEDALLSLQDSGLPGRFWEGVSGTYRLPSFADGPFNSWKISLVYSDGFWRLHRIGVSGGGGRQFMGFILQMTEDRISFLKRSGKPTHHFSRQKQVRLSSEDGSINKPHVIWLPPEASQR